eukprot:4013513-Pyramimonas_sp.AAC.1
MGRGHQPRQGRAVRGVVVLLGHRRLPPGDGSRPQSGAGLGGRRRPRQRAGAPASEAAAAARLWRGV